MTAGRTILAGLRRPGAAQGTRATGLVLLWRRLRFPMALRVEIWQLLADIMTSRVALGDTLEALIEGYRRTGRGTGAAVLAEFRAGETDGDMADRIRPYASPAERLIFEGLGTRDAAVIFGSAARLLRNRLAMRKAFLDAIALPILLFAGLIGIILFFGLQLLPALEEVIDLYALTGLQGWIVRATLAFTANPALLALWFGGGLATLILAARYWTGPGRAQADKVPPFSVVRLHAGTGFLFAVIEYGRAGAAVTPDLLHRMAAATGRYEASRIRALATAMERAPRGNLGEAALAAGQGFPGDDFAVVLRLLWNRKQGIDRAGEFLERRLAGIETMVKARMAVLNAVLMITVAAALLALISIVLPIVDQINQGIGSV